MKEALQYLEALDRDRMDLQKLYLNKFVLKALEIAVKATKKEK
jgi:hypothetical protein